MRDIPHPDLDRIGLADIMRGFGDPVRLHMVASMHALGECECSLVYAGLGLSKSNASHHFRVLRESGVLRRTRRGNQQYVALRTDELEKRFPGLLDSVLANIEPQPPEGGTDGGA
ncbi:ArsR/SmtB family transcription factor [Trujillonella humicola]|uniref:ArsR/SmtB family transcription factor n=1 Tax=Trujillonella humicola TaxID=3383699 RepID=UPI003905BB6A